MNFEIALQENKSLRLEIEQLTAEIEQLTVKNEQLITGQRIALLRIRRADWVSGILKEKEKNAFQSSMDMPSLLHRISHFISSVRMRLRNFDLEMHWLECNLLKKFKPLA